MKLRLQLLRCYRFLLTKLRIFNVLILFLFLGFTVLIKDYYQITNQNKFLTSNIKGLETKLETQFKLIENLQLEIIKVSTIANENANAFLKINKNKHNKDKVTVVDIENIKDVTDAQNSKKSDDISLNYELSRIWNEYKNNDN